MSRLIDCRNDCFKMLLQSSNVNATNHHIASKLRFSENPKSSELLACKEIHDLLDPGSHVAIELS